jgi:hypothetical protein
MRVFLSSTYEDLAQHRSAVENSLSISGIPYNAMEHFGSTPRPPIQTCLDAVRASDAFVGILGVRYGGCPPGKVRSYTEREYRCAKQQGMPVFMFLIDGRDASVPAQYVGLETPEEQGRLRAFKGLVLSHHTVTFFTNPHDLARLVLASLIKELGVLP